MVQVWSTYIVTKRNEIANNDKMDCNAVIVLSLVAVEWKVEVVSFGSARSVPLVHLIT